MYTVRGSALHILHRVSNRTVLIITVADILFNNAITTQFQDVKKIDHSGLKLTERSVLLISCMLVKMHL